MLYEPDRHEPLIDSPWDAGRAGSAIREILRDAADCGPDWRGEDLVAGWAEGPPPNNIYEGVAGLLWALDYLSDYVDDDALDTSGLASSAYDGFLEYDRPTLIEHHFNDSLASYFIGETGILSALWRLDRKRFETLRPRLLDLVRTNMDNPTLEPLWGGTGSIIPLIFDLERHGAQESREALNEHAAFYRDALWEHEDAGALWTQDMYGAQIEYLGAGHGFVGNMYPFLRAEKELEEDLARWAVETTIDTVKRTVIVEDDAANWSGAAGIKRMLLQWCHGAPGFIVALAPLRAGVDNEFDRLLLMAGEAIWRAGPLTKGAGLCHGTAGNGYALLKLFRRTGDQLWLDRARAFAMHAIGQRSGDLALWVGDAGLACYLHACITEQDGVPLLDIV